MDLKEFISNSLTQIVEWIRDAQARTADSDAWVSPRGEHMPPRAGANQIAGTEGHQYLDEVKFDVAISVTEGKRGAAKGSLKILVASIGAEGSLSSQHGAVSRIQFAVPVVWPGSTNSARQKMIEENKFKATQANAMRRRLGGRNSWMGN